MSKFPNRLKELRKKRELLSKDLAKIMCVEPATITTWEKGNRFPKDDALIKIADYFDCSIDYLLGRTDDYLEDIYTGNLPPQTITIQIDKESTFYLTSKEVENIIRQLDFVGLNVKKLIEGAKNKSL